MTLPDPVRQRVLQLAAAELGAMPELEVPPALRPVRKFAPARRARAAAVPLATAVEEDRAFRARVADRLRAEQPDLVAALSEGRVPAAAPVGEAVAAAYLLSLPLLDDLLDQWRAEAAQLQASDELDQLRAQVERLGAELADARAAAAGERARLEELLAAARAETEAVRRQLRQSGDRVKRAAAEADAQVAAAGARAEDAVADAAQARAEASRLAARLVDAELAVTAARASAAEPGTGRRDARLKVLLDTLLASAQGLRRELDLPLGLDAPADAVAVGAAEPGLNPLLQLTRRGRDRADPAMLDEVLAVPGVHLVVDGYNVSKLGFGQLSLEGQRTRLVSGLVQLRARASHAEITCVFDGYAQQDRVPAAVRRDVRVQFSPVGVLADEVVVALVAAEPPGRAVAVVTNDAAVARAAQRAGALVLPSEALVRRLVTA